MARIAPIEHSDDPRVQTELDRQRAAHGRVTHMKRTLAHSPASLDALMTWYPLRDEVAARIGERPTTLFVHAVSTETDCLVFSTYFRRTLAEAGEDPDHVTLDARETAIVEYGRALTRGHAHVPDDAWSRVAAVLAPADLVALTALGGMMIATNVFNNALRVDLDGYLEGFRRPGGVR
jgi:alkylhydroperoxidase family enzyme